MNGILDGRRAAGFNRAGIIGRDHNRDREYPAQPGRNRLCREAGQCLRKAMDDGTGALDADIVDELAGVISRIGNKLHTKAGVEAALFFEAALKEWSDPGAQERVNVAALACLINFSEAGDPVVFDVAKPVGKHLFDERFHATEMIMKRTLVFCARGDCNVPDGYASQPLLCEEALCRMDKRGSCVSPL